MLLRDYQKQISHWIRSPEGVAQALTDEDAKPGRRKDSVNARERLESTVWGDARGSALDRVSIYANAYFERIHGALVADYPALVAHLGTDLFRDVVTSYLLVFPSTQPSLRYAGASLASFLSTHEAAAGIRQRLPACGDLATFEWARIDAFDAPNRGVLNRDRLLETAPEAFVDLQMVLGPWAFLHHFDWPVHALWKRAQPRAAGTQEGESALEGTRELTSTEFAKGLYPLVIWRRHERVYHRVVDPFEAEALAWLSLGGSFGSLCEWIAERQTEASAPAQATAWLEQWLADGLLENGERDPGDAGEWT